MTYYESAQGVRISQARAFQEVRDHQADLVDFINEVGALPDYAATDVLDWLGY